MWRLIRLFPVVVAMTFWNVSSRSPGQELPRPQAGQTAKPQPILFSHKVHARLGLRCLDCHEMPPPGWDVTYPAEQKCMQCHSTTKKESPEILRLAEYYKDGKAVPWIQIYQVPDYVYFSHKTHYKKAEIACEVCHGPVAERDVIAKEKPTSMAACIECHEARQARVTCRTCHN